MKAEDAATAMARDIIAAGLVGATLPTVLRKLAELGWRKTPSLASLEGQAKVVDPDEVNTDQYFVYGFDGFGHTVELEQVGHHPAASLIRAIQKYGAGSPTSIPGVSRAEARYNPIWLVQLLAVHGDEGFFWPDVLEGETVDGT